MRINRKRASKPKFYPKCRAAYLFQQESCDH